MAALANIALSASTIVLQNKFKAERDPKEKCTYFITNKSRYSRRIRVSLSDKTDSAFSLSKGAKECYIAAGLSMPIVVNYRPTDYSQHKGEILIFVNDQEVSVVPIAGILPSAHLKASTPKLDFGTQVSENQIVSKYFNIVNYGNLEGHFSFQGSLSSYLTVYPKSGKVRPNQAERIQVDLMCEQVGDVEELIRFTVDNQEDDCLQVCVKCCVIERVLKVLDPSGHQNVSIEKLSLDNVYFGAITSKRLYLHNDSPVVSDFVIVIDNDMSGSINASRSLAMALSTGGEGEKDPMNLDTIFKVYPNKGTLKPYERRMIELKFSPKSYSVERGWNHCHKEVAEMDYSVLIRCIVTNKLGADDGSKMITVSASATPVSVEVVPGKMIHFGSCSTGGCVTKSVEISNGSSVLPLKFQCHNLAHYKCSPSSGSIDKGKSVTLTLSFLPKQLGQLNFQFLVDFWGPQSNVLRKDSVIHTEKLDLKGKCVVSTHGATIKRTKRIAKPDDLARSIRPWSCDDNGANIVTTFTKIPRYSYIDVDYTYSMEEAEAKLKLKSKYSSFLNQKHSERMWKLKEKTHSLAQYANEVDIGIAPACGLQSPTVFSCDMDAQDDVCSRKDVEMKDMNGSLEFCENCPAHILDTKAINECRRTIPPDELNSIVIEPLKLNFGKVVVKSLIGKAMQVKNLSRRHISVKVEMCDVQLECTSYPGKSIFFFVLYPCSYTSLHFVMMHHKPGNIKGSLKITINQVHVYNLPVFAVIYEPHLELSSSTITLSEQSPIDVDAGFWGSVEIRNNYDVPVLFKWSPKNQLNSDNFIALQSAGVVPPNANLLCGFIYAPSYDSPSSSESALFVGNATDKDYQVCNILKFNAKFQKTICRIGHRRLLFGTIPLNLTSTGTTTIVNQSDTQAYYKVSSVPGNLNVEVIPSSGPIPGGGEVQLEIRVCPTVVGSFDVKMCIYLREGKQLCMRLAGTVEQPKISVEQEIFHFGGVLCGSKGCVPYVINNQGSCRAELTFDFTHLHAFDLVLADTKQDHKLCCEQRSDSTLLLRLPGNSSISCNLVFKPQEIAAYDFFLTLLVNGLKPPSPPASPWPPSNTYSSMLAAEESTVSFSDTPTRRVIATVLQSPLEVVNSTINFSFPPLSSLQSVIHEKCIILRNIGNKSLTWSLQKSDDIFQFVSPDNSNELKMDRTSTLNSGESFQLGVMCSPVSKDPVAVAVPLFVNNYPSPYCELSLSATFPSGTITVKPSRIEVSPIPLGIMITGNFRILMERFPRSIELDVSVPTNKDQSLHFAVKVSESYHFLEYSDFKAEVPCTFEFKSAVPVSKTGFIIITEKNSGIKCEVPFILSADNSIFSVYSFVSKNLDNARVEANKGIPDFRFNGQRKMVSLSNCSLVSSDNASSTDIEMYYQDSIKALCRWLSSYGNSRILTIKSPSDICVKIREGSSRNKHRSHLAASKGTLLEIVTHLCGRTPPGIPLSLPQHTSAIEAIIQLYSLYNVLLTFLRNQGAILCGVAPEDLLDYKDYLLWNTRIKKGPNPKHEEDFCNVSTQAWTCVLMQVMKVLVLPRLLKEGDPPQEIKNQLKSLHTTQSNIYSTWERSLLVWLNHHYKLHRHLLCSGESLNEVVNFDVDLMDGIVLSSVVLSYCPFLMSSHFSGLFNEPSSREQCAHNAVIVIKSLRHIGINYGIQQNDFCSPNPIFMVLFCAYLYFVLPSFKPKSSIRFSAPLANTDEVKIKVSNSSSKETKYSVLIRGEKCQNFTSSPILTVQSHSSSELAVQYYCSSLSEAKAYIYLVPHGRLSNGCTLSYSLIGSATGALPKVRKRICTHLYESAEVELQLTNCFTGSGNFRVLLYESDNSNFLHMSGERVSRSSALISSVHLRKRSTDGLELFHSNDEVITLDPGSSHSITVCFVPLKLQGRYCCVVASSKELGDVVFSITAIVNSPIPLLPETSRSNHYTFINSDTRTLHLSATTETILKESIVIHNSNLSLENALLEISKSKLTDTYVKSRLLTESLHYAALSNGVANPQQMAFLETCNEADTELLLFRIEGSDDQHFIFPDHIKVPIAIEGSAVIPIEFQADQEGLYECHMLLKSGYDIRTIIIEASVSADEHPTQIEFRTQAIKAITQIIPVVNPSTSDWSLSATISSPQFSGPPAFVAHALTTTCYPLTFSPQIEGTVKGELELINLLDSTRKTFTLVGVAERPLAQDKIRLKAVVKERKIRIVHVPNLKDKTTTFSVESDLDFIAGPGEVTISGNDTADYPLTILPKNHGSYSGALVFTAKPSLTSLEVESGDSQSAYHIWFQIECDVEHGPPDEVISVSCPVFSKNVVQLKVDNPHNEILRLNVNVDGKYVCGSKEMILDPLKTSLYDIIFSPHTVGKFTASVMFEGSVDGEFWYELALEALNPKPVDMQAMESEVGRNSRQVVTLENPLDVPVTFTCNNSNTEHYTVTGLADGHVVISPHSKLDLPVFFYPSTVGIEGHDLQLVFSSSMFGDQVFHLKGTGLLPSCMDPTTVNANVKSASVHIINFVNPLQFGVHISVLLSGKDSARFFLLHKKANDIFLRRSQSVDIPIMFAPEDMYRHKITVTIVANARYNNGKIMESDNLTEQRLCWEYPVYGQPELRLYSNDDAPTVVCHAKEHLEQIVGVTLVKSLDKSAKVFFKQQEDTLLTDIHNSGKYSCSVQRTDGSSSFLIDQAIALQLLGEDSKMTDQNEIALVFKLVFAPSKTFHIVRDVVISDNKGGIWVLPLKFHALPASPDDTIIIESNGLNKEARVTFTLSSPTQFSVPFTAHFVSGSDQEITASPLNGTLRPQTSEGTSFLVTYKPTIYGKKHHAKLIIQCEVGEWCYEIIGKLPSYKIPTGKYNSIETTSETVA